MTALEWSALGLSLRVALAAVVCGLPVALALGWWLARTNFRGKSLVETVVTLPLVLPPVVVGYLLLVSLGRQGWLGRWLEGWGFSVVFDWKGAALASMVMALPLMVRATRLAFASVDRRLEEAARTLGASPWEVFWTVSLPLSKSGVIAAAVLGFARSMGEFGATILLAGNIPGRTQTVPLFLYSALEAPDGWADCGRLVIVSILLATVAIFVGNWLEQRQMVDGRPREHSA